MRVLLAAPGPPHHGVVQHARSLGRLLRAHGVEVVGEGPADATLAVYAPALWGGPRGFLEALRDVPRPVLGSLHDVTAAYAPVAAACDAVVVGSAREASLLPGAHLVPLPVEPLAPPGPAPSWVGRTSLGVLGFVYPGKGHQDVVDAAPPGGLVVAIGAASPGHDDLVVELHGRRPDVDVLVTGPLEEGDLHAAALAVTVPVAAYRTPGASASLATWMSAGRRPVATPSPQAVELERRWPGSVLLADDLAASLRAAVADPSMTHRETPAPRPDVGAAHLALLRSLVGA